MTVRPYSNSRTRRRVISRLTSSVTAAAIAVTLITAAPALADTQSDALEPLLAEGATVAVTGQIAQVVADPSEETTTYLFVDDTTTVRIDDATLPGNAAVGDQIEAVVEVPAEVVADVASELAATDHLEEAAQGAVDEETDTGQVLLEAAEAASADAGAGGESSLTQARVLESAAAEAAAPPAGGAHELRFVFMSKNGRGKFYTREQLDQFAGYLSAYWVRESHGVITKFNYSWDTAVAAQSTLQCGASLWTIAQEAANLLGVSYASATAARNHLVILSPEDERVGCATSDYQGIASLGSQGLNSGGQTHIFAYANPAGYSRSAFVHEIGHNFSLRHAGTATCPAGHVDGPYSVAGGCNISSTIANNYGDYRNVMGRGSDVNTTLNGFQKRQLQLISSGSGLVTVQGGVDQDYTLASASSADLAAVHALNIKEQSGAGYWIEYDQVGNGVAIRRDCSTILSGCAGAAEANLASTRILSPGTTVEKTTNQVWTVGQKFTSESGKIEVKIISLAGGQAVVHVTLGDQETIVLSRSSWETTWPEATATVTVTTNGANWSAKSNASWLTVTPASGANGSVATIRATKNTSATARSGAITFTADGVSKSVAVVQSGVTDDYGNTVDTAARWQFGGTTGNTAKVSGTLEVGPDVDVFKFTAPVSGTYRFISEGTGNVSGYLYDESGQQIS
ncbi:MAG: hypothetical protein LBS27_04465, partial [Bifidobacteriaceae bacterium]|nr:hypothetical protein [Bifidobacteriaceae bacterium]